MKRPSLVAAGVGVAITLFLAVSPAAAQQYPPAADSIGVDDATVVPGETIEITITGSTPGTTWSFTFLSHAVFLGTATANADGVVTFFAQIPSDATAGPHTIVASAGGFEISVTVTVLATGAVSAGPSLALTGQNTTSLARVGVVLVATGGVAVLAARRRRQASREPEPERV